MRITLSPSKKPMDPVSGAIARPPIVQPAPEVAVPSERPPIRHQAEAQREHPSGAETDCSLARPVIISCAGRSGSTLFYRLLAQHKDLGWLSTYNQAFPRLAWVSIASRLYGKRVLHRFQNSFVFPKPFAAYEFWKLYLPDIARRDRPLLASDVPDTAIGPLRRRLAKILKYQGKRRLLIKVTGWARMAYFNRLFPDAYFVYLKRQPIAVVASWVNAGWLNVTGEIDTDAWEWGEIPEMYRQWYHELGGGPLLSAAIKTQLDIDDLRRNAAQFPGRCYELRYEDFIADPRRFLRETLEHCQLPWYRGFDAVLARTAIHNYSDRWKKHISPPDAERLLEFFRRAGRDWQEGVAS